MPIRVRCSVCHHSGTILAHLWAVCPCCQTWICRVHVRETPGLSCPHCQKCHLKSFAGDARGGGSHCCALLGGMPTSAAAALPGYLGLTSTVRLFASAPKQHRYDSIRNTLEDWLRRIRDVKTSETTQKTAQQKSLTSGRRILNGITSSALLAARNAWLGVGSVIERLKDVEALYPGLFGTTTAGACFMTAQHTKFTVDFLMAKVGLPNDAESVSLADYLAWSSPSTDDLLQAWLMMNYGRDDEECIRDVTSLLRRGTWSYLYFPAADNLFCFYSSSSTT